MAKDTYVDGYVFIRRNSNVIGGAYGCKLVNTHVSGRGRIDDAVQTIFAWTNKSPTVVGSHPSVNEIHSRHSLLRFNAPVRDGNRRNYAGTAR